MEKKIFLALFSLLLQSLVDSQKQVKLTVQNQVLHKIPSTLYGVILETNINGGTDGGLYAELMYNRGMQENGGSIVGYEPFINGSLKFDSKNALNSNLPGSLLVSASGPSVFGYSNYGWKGIAVRALSTYNLTLWVKKSSNSKISGLVSVSLESKDGKEIYAASSFSSDQLETGFKKFELKLRVPATSNPKSGENRLSVRLPSGSEGDFHFGFVSLFPPTFKNRHNGARKDLADSIQALNPAFVRLPGGNSLEGINLNDRYVWNATLGKVEERRGRKGVWMGWDTEGFGLLELAQFTEDLGAEIILAVWGCYSLDHARIEESKMQPYIDEAIREIEFLTSDASSNEMGALRAKLGHPKPFRVNYVEIGNEDEFDGSGSYAYRWNGFKTQLGKRFPKLTFIATTGNSIPRGSYDAVDDHDYNTPNYFISNFRRYEKSDRPLPKVFAGEYAVVRSNSGAYYDYSTISAAVAEAVYMIGLERSSDLVFASCYAPILQNVDYSQWAPDLISFNAVTLVNTVSYWAEWLLYNAKGDNLLNSYAQVKGDNKIPTKGGEGDGKLGNLYFAASESNDKKTAFIKFANPGNETITIFGQTGSMDGVGYSKNLRVPKGFTPETAKNTIANPSLVTPTNGKFSVKKGVWIFQVEPSSISVLVISK